MSMASGPSSLPWSRLWLTAIAAATLKQLGRADGLRVSAKLTGVMADERLHGVIDHFVRLLDFTPSELQRAGADTDGHLLPRLRAVSSPVAIFIDGVDEYFNKHIESRASLPSVTGPLSPNVWYFAQLGLVEQDYAWLTERIKAMADRHAQGRIVSCLEGGYALDALARSVEAHLRVLAGV